MSGGKVNAEGLTVLHGLPLDRRLAHQNTVLRECLAHAMRELTFAALPTTRQALRAIRQQLADAGLEVSA